MKKVAIFLAAVVLILAVSALWIWRSMGPTDPAGLLPGTTVVMASLPDLPRTAMRWPQTTLSKIGADPEIKAFLEKPLSHLAKNQGGDEAVDLLFKLKPGRLFTALVGLSSSDSALLIGFQFWGGAAGYDAAVARLRQELSKSGPVETKTEPYEGGEIVSTVHGTHTLYSGRQGYWGFLSNNLPALKDALDRAAGRRKGDSLADLPAYQKVARRLPGEPDFLLFAQPQSALETLLAVGQSMGAQVDPAQLDQLRKIEAIGASTKLDGADIRDSIFVLRPEPPDVGTLTHSSLKLTSLDTLAYFDGVANLKQGLSATSHPAVAALQNNPSLQDSQILAKLPKAFGPEFSISVAWTAGLPKPGALLTVQVQDAVLASECLNELLTFFPETSMFEKDGTKFYSFPSLQNMFANPTVALTDGFFLLGLDGSDVERALEVAKNGENLQKSPSFSHALAAYRTANETFGYVDVKALVERSFPMASQLLSVGAAISPQIGAVIDGSKIPSTTALARHLQPIVYGQTRLPDGYLLESSGPISMNQAAVLAAAAGFSASRLIPGLQ